MARDKRYFVHESSCIDEGVNIGEGTKIWHFSHVMRNAQIGRKCTLGQNVLVGPNVKIGNNVKIQNNVSVYEGVVLEDNVFCGPSCVFTNDLNPRAAYAKAPSDYVHTLVNRGATIGANATIVCGYILGEHSFVGAGAVVTSDVPAYSVMYGVPARLRGWICRCGELLSFRDKRGRCPKCGAEYTRVSPNKVIPVEKEKS